MRSSLSPDEAEFYEAEAGEPGIRLVAQKNPDIVLLDLGLPDIDGIDVVLRLREWTAVPIIILSARGRESDKIAALDAGADDYLTKPFSIGELMARVRAALRHAAPNVSATESAFTSNGLTVDFESRKVLVEGSEIRLTPTEFKIVSILARHAGRVLTHNYLLKEVWGPGYEDSTQSLRVHMASIRRKLEKDPSRPQYIRTETGVGYRMLDPV